MVVTTVDFFSGAAPGASSPAMALKRLGRGAFGSSVYSGNGKKVPPESILAFS
jgi:hypothetical protein